MTCREYDWRTIEELQEFERREREKKKRREGVGDARRRVELAERIRGVIRQDDRVSRRVMIRPFSFARRNDDGDDLTTAAWSSMNLQDRCVDLALVVGQGWSRKSVSSPQAARTPLVDHGAAGRMPRGLPTRRGLQTLALVIATAYATILLYQAVAPRQVIGAIVVIILYRRIVPCCARSLSILRFVCGWLSTRLLEFGW